MGYQTFDFCKPYLTVDEKILLKCTPQKWFHITWYDICSLGMGIFICTFILKSVLTAETMNTESVLLPLIMCLMAGGVTIGGTVVRLYKRSKTAYVITNEKVIRKRGKTVDVMSGKDMSPIQITRRNADGSGTIQLGIDTHSHYRSRGITIAKNTFHLFTLENIPDVIDVYSLLTEQVQK